MSPKHSGVVFVRLICLGGALLWILIVAWNPRLLERIELAALDTELRFTPAAHASSDIIIVALDDRAMHRYGPLRWPPTLWADLVNALDRGGARVIAFDFVFSEEAQAPERSKVEAQTDLSPLREAAQRSGKVIVGSFFDFNTDEAEALSPADPIFREHRIRKVLYLGGATSQLVGHLIPIAKGVHATAPELANVALAYGHLNIVPSDDGMIRSIPLLSLYQGDLYDAFSVEIARAYLGDNSPEVLVARQRVDGLALGNRFIATDEYGQVFLRFAGPRGSYSTYSAADVLSGRVSSEKIRDRVVLVGSTAAGSADVWATPSDPLLPGVEIHANAVDNLLWGKFLVRNWLTRMLAFAELALLGIVGAFVLPWALRFGMWRLGQLSSVFVALWLAGHGLLFARAGYAVSLVATLLAIGTMLGGTLALSYFTTERRRRQVEHSFVHYLDRSVVKEIMEHPDRLRLGGERRELSVLFCDIRNFTMLAEGLAPEATVAMLNEFFTTMSGVIFSSSGLVDKFVGDQIMAIWGAPLETANHAASACGAALAMIKAFRELRTRWADLPIHLRGDSMQGSQPVQPGFNCGIGINSGPMVVGNIGSARRFSYTVIGDNVNVASRLEGLNKLYGTQILVGPATVNACSDEFRFREIDLVRVRGRAQALTIYELFGTRQDLPPDEDWLAAFAEGLDAYRRQDWAVARRGFTFALTKNPSDACAKFYLSRVEQLVKNSPVPAREGVSLLR
jgi:adenylate cyclase